MRILFDCSVGMEINPFFKQRCDVFSIPYVHKYFRMLGIPFPTC